MPSLWHYLLYLYPPAHRLEFCEEMVAVLCERQAETRTNGVMAIAGLYAREIAGLLGGAVKEHARALTGLYPWEMVPVRRRLGMRSEFRFPKATPVLMTLILAAVIMAIEKARAIQMSVPASHTQVGPIRSADFTVLPSFALWLVLGCAVGAVGWAIVFTLRRSGMQRLEELRGSGGKR
jgi:hypothetical protein